MHIAPSLTPGDPPPQPTFNPHLLIGADWEALMLVGAFGWGFQPDLDHPRCWQSVWEQPDCALCCSVTPGLGTGSDDRQTEPATGSAGLRPRVRVHWLPQPDACCTPSGQADPAVVASAQLTSGRCCPGLFFSPDGARVMFLDRPAPDAELGIWSVAVDQPLYAVHSSARSFQPGPVVGR